MLALYRSGRQAEALEAYRDGRRLLASEVSGLEQGPGFDRRRTERSSLRSPECARHRRRLRGEQLGLTSNILRAPGSAASRRRIAVGSVLSGALATLVICVTFRTR